MPGVWAEGGTARVGGVTRGARAGVVAALAEQARTLIVAVETEDDLDDLEGDLHSLSGLEISRFPSLAEDGDQTQVLSERLWVLRRLVGGDEPRVIYGLATDGVATDDLTFTIDNIAVLTGTDPRPSPVSTSQTITVNNTFSISVSNNEVVRAEQGYDGAWSAMRPGAKGDPGSAGISGDGIMFELVEDLTTSATSAKAKILDVDGSAVTTGITVAETVADSAARLAMAEGSGAGEEDIQTV